MALPDFKKIKNGRMFETFCADILAAEGFVIESEPSVDRTGFDIHVMEEIKSHSGHSYQIHWKVQCKHYAASNRSLSRTEVEKYLYAYECIREPDTGLFFIVDTEYTEAAIDRINQYTKSHKGSQVLIWNARYLSTVLERHPNLALKYDLVVEKTTFLKEFQSMSRFRDKKILIISDQSNLAHNVTAVFKFYNFDVTFLPVWNYRNPGRLYIFLKTVLKSKFDLIVSFLGDSFEFDFPESICKLLVDAQDLGTSLLFFPFFSFCTDKGLYKSIETLLPVRLKPAPDNNNTDHALGTLRFGDFSFLAKFDGFAEDQYTEIQPDLSYQSILPNCKNPIYLKHTFEFIEAKPSARTLLADVVGNPMLVINNSLKSKIAYFNTSTHSCLTTLPITSPLESNGEIALVFNDLFSWLLSRCD